ncbi:MAG: phospholipid carrier-dependent glycosyltransferase, partial [Noviherbaspirillum sp.]
VFGRDVGHAAGAVLASSLYWGLGGHISSLDMGLAAMMTLTLCSFLMAQRDGATMLERHGWMLAAWAGMALAVLSKGLVGVVLPGAVLVLHTLSTRDWRLWKRLHVGSGLLLFSVIAAPWFILVSQANPEFPHFFFIHEHLQRFTSHVHGREGPWYYFIPLLLAGTVPWLAVLPQSLAYGWRRAREDTREAGVLLSWAGVIFVFFSASGSKLPSYILPVFPALALLVALYLKHVPDKALRLAAAGFFLCCAIGLGASLVFLLQTRNAYEAQLYRSYLPWAVGAALVGVAGAVLSLWLAPRRPRDAIAVLAATALLAGQVALVGHEPLGRYKAGIEHVSAIRAELRPQTASAPIYLVGLYEQALPFYLERTLTLVASPGELEFGLRQEPRLWLPTMESFVARWQADRTAGRKAIAIMRPDTFSALEQAGFPMRVIAWDPRRVIVTNLFSQ